MSKWKYEIHDVVKVKGDKDAIPKKWRNKIVVVLGRYLKDIYYCDGWYIIGNFDKPHEPEFKYGVPSHWLEETKIKNYKQYVWSVQYQAHIKNKKRKD